jgi:ATP-dependent Lon protease
METNKENKDILMPTIAIRGMVLFPKMVIHFDIARDISIKAVEEAIKRDRKIFLVAQRDIFEKPR